jgi:hypothetical protein
MKLIGEIEIFGRVRLATVEIKTRKGKGVTYVGDPINKYKAYGYDDGKMKFYGYYDKEADAEEAARLRRNLAREKRARDTRATARKEVGTGVTLVGNAWRVQLSIGGQRVSLGRYATYGNAVLVRDVVARRSGRNALVADYEMPLALVNYPVARSYIRDRVDPATEAERAEYQRRVDALNRSVGVSDRATATAPVTATTATVPVAALPPETWRQKQPSRPTGSAGRSPFDTLDT